MPNSLPMSVWVSPPRSWLIPAGIYACLASLVVVSLGLNQTLLFAVLTSIWVIVPVGAWWMYPTERVTLTEDEVFYQARGREIRRIAIEDITNVASSPGGLGSPRDYVHIQDRSGVIAVERGYGTTDLLNCLGPLLVALGRDRAVIENERTRRWLGLPDGGLRDPWTPKA